MTDKTAQGATKARGPGVAALEGSVEHTKVLLAQFREELMQLVADVQCDVDRLRKAASGDAVHRPEIDPEGVEERIAERRLADSVAAEQLTHRFRALTNQIVDERFEALDRLVRAKLTEADVLRNMGGRRSRLRR